VIARYVTYRAAVIPIAFAISIPVALVSPYLAWACWFLSVPIQALVTRRFKASGALGRGATPSA
jgi:hypothetical protein